MSRFDTDITERLRWDKRYRSGHVPVTMEDAAKEIERLRAALYNIIEIDHHNMRPESAATKIARKALNNEQTAKTALCPGGLPCDTEQGCPYNRPQCREAIERGHWSVKR